MPALEALTASLEEAAAAVAGSGGVTAAGSDVTLDSGALATPVGVEADLESVVG